MTQSEKNVNENSNTTEIAIYSTWLLGEIAFNILPIAVILIINFSFGDSFKEIFLLPDWSFASIVLCGAGIGLSIELKAKLQNDLSYKTYTIIRVYTLMLIVAVIALTLGLLREKGIGINNTFLSVLQIFIFTLSSLLILTPIKFKIEFLDTHKFPANSLKPNRLINFMSYSLNEANINLRSSLVTISKNKASLTSKYQSIMPGSNIDTEIKQLSNLITSLEEILSLYKTEWEIVTASTSSKNEKESKST